MLEVLVSLLWNPNTLVLTVAPTPVPLCQQAEGYDHMVYDIVDKQCYGATKAQLDAVLIYNKMQDTYIYNGVVYKRSEEQ